MDHGGDQRYFIRLTLSQRIQHISLVITTVLLVITGFMIQAEASLITALGDYGETVFKVRGYIHRTSGVIAILTCVYHIFYVIISAEGRSWFVDMIPRPKDALDVYQNITYMLGFRAQRPKMDRFFYLEKMEYWSVWFGMTIVIVTGIMLWTEYLWSEFTLRIASAFHLGEATLATLAIIVGHIYAVHFNAHVYPINTTFIDGMISEDLMKLEHGMEYERVVAGAGQPPPSLMQGEVKRLIDDYRNAIIYALNLLRSFRRRKPDVEPEAET